MLHGILTFSVGDQGDLENELVRRFDVVQTQAVDSHCGSLRGHGVHGVGTHLSQSIPRGVATEHCTGRREILLHQQKQCADHCREVRSFFLSTPKLEVRLSANVVGCINEVNQRRARLVLGWASAL